MNPVGSALVFMMWLAGIFLAKGFWSTFFAVIIPPWGLYLLVERLVERFL